MPSGEWSPNLINSSSLEPFRNDLEMVLSSLKYGKNKIFNQGNTRFGNDCF